MSDSERSHIHLLQSRIALFFDEWNKHKLEFDDILVAPEHEPINPEEDDDVIPDQQHASFGLAKSQQNKLNRSNWKDLRTKELLFQGPDSGVSIDEVLEFPNFNPRPETMSLTSSSNSMPGFNTAHGGMQHATDTPTLDRAEGERHLSQTEQQPEHSLLLQDARANARRASSMITPTNDTQHVTTRSRTNALRLNRLATSTQRRRVPR